MREFVQRIHLELLAECAHSLFVFLLTPVRQPQIVVGEFVVGISLDGFLEGADGVVRSLHPEVSAAQVVPRVLVLGIERHDALEEFDRKLVIAVAEGCQPGLMQILGLGVFWDSRRAGHGGLKLELLLGVGADSAAKRQVVAEARRRQLAHTRQQHPFRREAVVFQTVAGAILAVIAFHRHRDRRPHCVPARQLQLQPHVDLRWRSQAQRFVLLLVRVGVSLRQSQHR